MIETRRAKIGWHWVFMMTLPFFALKLANAATHGLLPFTLNKFTEDPALMTFLNSIDIFMGMFLGPLVAFNSDRIWTRFGRRKPFILMSMFGAAMFLPIIPYTSTLVTLAIFLTGFNFFADINIFEPLFMEVVPQPQRGRAAAMRQGMVLTASIYINQMLLKSWDTSAGFEVGGKTYVLTGEQMVFWVIAVMLVCTGMLIGFGVREVKPDKMPPREAFSFKLIFKSIFMDKQLLKIYMLLYAIMAMGMGLANLGNLMLTNQFGYSKAQIADMFTYLEILQFVVALPIAGYIADKVDRLKLFIIGISISTAHPLLYWLFIHFVAENNIPTLGWIFFFNAFNNLTDFITNIAVMPLAYDYIPRARMGTLFAGMAIVRGSLRLLLTNSIGNFIKYYSKIFLPKGEIDYTSGYLLLFFIGLSGVACAVYFLHERTAGRVIPYGKIEHDEAAKKRQAAAEAEARGESPPE